MVCGSLHLQAFVGSADLGFVGKGPFGTVCFEQLPHEIRSFGLHVHNVPFVALR